MNLVLDNFLRSEDLDKTCQLRDNVNKLDEIDIQLILSILYANQDIQAISNLLMHPSLIPQSDRINCLIKQLQKNLPSYLTLSAIVGIQSLNLNEMAEDNRFVILRQIIYHIGMNHPTISQRASVVLEGLLQPHNVPEVIHFLKHPDPLIRNNVLVAIVSSLGIPSSRSILKTILKEEFLDSEVKSFLESKVLEIDELRRNEVVDFVEFTLSSLSTCQLNYIPNLRNWISEQNL